MLEALGLALSAEPETDRPALIRENLAAAMALWAEPDVEAQAALEAIAGSGAG